MLVVKNPPANAGDIRDTDLIPGLERFPVGGYSNPLQYSCLENPMDRGAWWPTVHRAAKSRTWLKWLSMYIYIFAICWPVFSTLLQTISIWRSCLGEHRGWPHSTLLPNCQDKGWIQTTHWGRNMCVPCSVFPPTSLSQVSEFSWILFWIIPWNKGEVLYLRFPKSENGLLEKMPMSVIKHFQREDILNGSDNSCLV